MATRNRRTNTRTSLFDGADRDAFHHGLADHRPPKDVRDAMRMARQWHRDNIVIRTGIGLQTQLANYGLRFRPATQKADPDAMKKWWAANQWAIKRFVRDTWEDWFILDNSVAFWRPKNPRCFVLAPEDCTYTDAFGIESLKVRLNWTPKNTDWKRTPELSRYANRKEVELDPGQGEEFSVLKRGRVGSGFAWPGMSSLFDDLFAWQSLQVGDKNWAYMARTAIRLVKIGHEIRNGQHAGSGKWFWSKTRSEAVHKSMDKISEGILKLNLNFDHSIEYPFLSSDRWDAKRYDGLLARISLWLGPVGQVITPRTNDFLAKMLRSWAEGERESVEQHISLCINGCFNPPVPVVPVWSNRIFTDNRLIQEMTKALLQSGPLSQSSALEEAGFDPSVERSLKAEESLLPVSMTLPLFDPAHGKRPADPAGRPKEGM